MFGKDVEHFISVKISLGAIGHVIAKRFARLSDSIKDLVILCCGSRRAWSPSQNDRFVPISSAQRKE
jgi:hypothetical protein